MDDVRWLAPNRYCTLPVESLRKRGLRIALEGEAPARLAVAADNGCIAAGYEYAARHRCPLVAYLWDLPPWRLGRGKPDVIFEAFGRIRRIGRPFGGYRERPGFYSRIGWVARRADQVWCPSISTMNEVVARFAVRAERVPFCYDSERFRPGARLHRPPRDRPVLLSVSRLVPHKHHAVLIRAAARLPSRPEVRLIGRGPEAAPLRALARELGVALVLTDQWADDSAVLAAYRTADVVVAPSGFEGFGLTPIEAIATGAPVVASDIPPHREFLGDLATFVPVGDDAALARAIEEVLNRPRGPVLSGSPVPFPELTIDACAERFLARFEPLLRGRR